MKRAQNSAATEEFIERSALASFGVAQSATGHRVELAFTDGLLKIGVHFLGATGIQPYQKGGVVRRGKQFDGLLDFLQGAHIETLVCLESVARAKLLRRLVRFLSWWI